MDNIDNIVSNISIKMLGLKSYNLSIEQIKELFAPTKDLLCQEHNKCCFYESISLLSDNTPIERQALIKLKLKYLGDNFNSSSSAEKWAVVDYVINEYKLLTGYNEKRPLPKCITNILIDRFMSRNSFLLNMILGPKPINSSDKLNTQENTLPTAPVPNRIKYRPRYEE